MPKRCIAIEYSSSYCRAVQASPVKDMLTIEKAVTLQGDSLQRVREELIKAGFNLSLPAVVMADTEKCHYSNIDATVDNIAPADDTDSLSPPVHIDDAIRIHLPGEHKLLGKNPSNLVITTDKSEIDNITAFAAANKIKCASIELPIFALIAAAKEHINGSEPVQMIVYISSGRMIDIAFMGQEPALVRNLPLPAGNNENIIIKETQLAWRAAFGSQIPEDGKILIINADNSNPEQNVIIKENLGGDAVIASIDDIGAFSPEMADREEYYLAVGAAEKYLNPGGYLDINLLRSVAKAEPVKPTGIQVKICIILAAMIYCLLFSYIINKNILLSRIHSEIIEQIDSVFAENVPELKDKSQSYVPKKKLAIMEDTFKDSSVLQRLFAEVVNNRISILDVLAMLGDIKDDSITFSQIDIDNDTVSATAVGKSLELLKEFEGALAKVKGFTVVSSELDDNTLKMKLKILTQ